MLNPLADTKHIALRYAPAEPLPSIAMDVDRVSQVLYNLLINAIRYSDQDTIVQINAYRDNCDDQEWIYISIRDQGAGIDSADLPCVFECFYRNGKSRSRESGGSGLGLAVVKQLGELHGGQITAESEPGRGSVFTVRLPVNG